MLVIGGLVIVMIMGLILAKLGRPYNGFVFNIHKLLALATIVWTFIMIRNHLIVAQAGSLMIILLVIMTICVIALFATGAMLSIGKIDQSLLKNIHLPLSLLLSVSTLAFVIMFLKKFI